MTANTPRLAYTRREVAEMCGVSVNTISEAKASGALKAKRLKKDETQAGGKELYRIADVEAWLESLADA